MSDSEQSYIGNSEWKASYELDEGTSYDTTAPATRDSYLPPFAAILGLGMALSQREMYILKRLKTGKSLKRIAYECRTSPPSISGSLVRIKAKLIDIVADADFLLSIGMVKASRGKLELAVRNPKDLKYQARR